MTNIYIYCLFDKDEILKGVYSSIKIIHRDALKLCNQGLSPVFVRYGKNQVTEPSITLLRSLFKGEIDTKVIYISDTNRAVILKTKLKE